jgi:hypothetical protein
MRCIPGTPTDPYLSDREESRSVQARVAEKDRGPPRAPRVPEMVCLDDGTFIQASGRRLAFSRRAVPAARRNLSRSPRAQTRPGDPAFQGGSHPQEVPAMFPNAPPLSRAARPDSRR